jgi:very-short-patch-repair endonuclease
MKVIELPDQSSTATKQQPSVMIHAEIAAKINFACHQSAFPLLRDLSIENPDEENRLEGLTVELTCDPDFVKPKSWRIDRLAAGGRISISARDLDLRGEFLLNLADSMHGTVTVTVSRDEEIIAEQDYPVELLAYNEWGGAGFMPDLLAAFSMPNDPTIDKILKKTAEMLRRSGDDAKIDGYESRSRERVWKLASGIYSAIASMGIEYALPPASFERDGQKIRLPGDIAAGGVATCLDTTMLFASCLEQAGLNPIIVLPEGHALVGVWLQPEELSTIVIDEAETLRKRIQLRELILIETTMLTSHPTVSFQHSIKKAEEIVTPDRDDSFNVAVDIKRARSHRITPLGLKIERSTSPGDELIDNIIELPIEAPPPLPDFDFEVHEEIANTPQSRLERWQRKLLDLSARNPLLSHRSTKTSLKIICPDPGELEDKLAEGTRISIAPVPAPTSQAQDEEIHRDRTGERISEEYARDALQRKQVLVDLSKEELQKRSVEIYRKAQTSLQEGGSNTLFLALGFLLWKRDDKSEKRFRAPLILVPVTLERRSVKSGVKLMAHDDESKFNTTLLEMLRKDFDIKIGGLDGELPQDESGVDVDGIWNKVRKAIKDAPGFEVIEEVVLGHFSFAKYLMWKDLVDRTTALKDNRIVQHLIDSPRDPYESGVSFVQRDEVDKLFEPADLLVPLPADASQMAAVGTADRGKDFIIIGPPGTGKSQTISNLITHLLGTGKTVLFVSEKIAALNVVYRRLDEIGLGRFCLELHSNKAKKLDVLVQLGSAWDNASSKSAQTWDLEAQKLKGLRDRLNVVVERLHKRRRNGMSAHEAMGIKIRDEELASRVALHWPHADVHSEDSMRAMRSTVDNLQVQATAVGNFANSPFQIITSDDWSPQWESEIAAKMSSLAREAEACDHAFAHLSESLGLSLENSKFDNLYSVENFAALLTECYRMPAAFALEPEAQESIDALAQAVTRLRNYTETQAGLSCSYEPFAWRKLDGADLANRWSIANNSWFLKAFFAKRAIVKEMKLGGAHGQPNPGHDAGVLRRLRKEGEAIDALDSQLSIFKQWNGHDTDPDLIEEIRVLGDKVKQAVGQLASDVSQLVEYRSKVRTLLRDGNDLLAPEGPVGRAATEFLKKMFVFTKLVDEVAILGGQSVQDHFADHENIFTAIKETADSISERHAELNSWCSWRRRRNEAVDMSLLQLVEAIEGGQVPIDEISETFEASYCTWWSGQLITEDEVLRTFNTAEHTASIEKFRKTDDEFQKITAAHVVAKLSGHLPNQNDTKRTSQWGVLKREMQKKRQHKSVRQLVDEIPDVITSLAPCLMMSPLSVAQYLPASQALFDVVIFDEASQITVWDAVGAIARGKQTIIAGDPKQMPPTNFFARSDDDPDGDIDQEGDLESILDELIGASIPECTLNLHYRSRRESLIAFSNSRYYDDTLITFPAPVTPDKGVSLIRPDGFYARGKARHNEGEARAIVAEIARRLTHENVAIRDQSIGVVCFNAEQQNLIENLLDDERRRNSKIEWAFSTEKTEPVFVKNLEAVQGDERDVILFSITYGPDRAGHVTMNFGPLNKQGGERRLNVAMTRARSEMVVFSTLRPEDIDLSRSQAEAVKDLKHFLEYAERGPLALAAAVHGSVADFDSPFEIAVARELKRKGWIVHQQIGVSAYRIDLGIVHPDLPGVYIAGVECDGAMYHSTAYARERDKIRQTVLEGLGWTIMRVWSTDWWVNKPAAFQSLDNALTALLEEDRRKRKEEEVVEAKESKAQESYEPSALEYDGEAAYEDNGKTEFDEVIDLSSDQYELIEAGTSDYNNAPEAIEGSIANAALEDFSGSEPSAVHLPNEIAPNIDLVSAEAKYALTEFSRPHLAAKPEQFFNDDYEYTIRNMIDHVIDTEGPIHESVLVRRIARHHGFKKAGSRIRERVLAIAKSRRGSTVESVGRFYWQKGTVKEKCTQVRYQNRNDEMRNVEFICKEELQAVDSALGLNGNVVALSRAFGLTRLREVSRQRLEMAIRG